MSPTVIVAYLALFASVGFLFVFACLLLGRFLRPHAPTPQKLDTYECGEPSVGTAAVQFDLRFYVVALLFLIFEVEVVLFFPPAAIYGQAIGILSGERTVQSSPTDRSAPAAKTTTVAMAPKPLPPGAVQCGQDTAHSLALVALVDMGVFFAVLLVGFAYLWKRGDLDWVRAIRRSSAPEKTVAMPATR